jgi:hypothetical protein
MDTLARELIWRGMSFLRAVVAASALAAVAGAPPAAARPACAGIADRDARLACFDRAAQAPARVSPGAGSCTRSSPCVGPRGGVYYVTASGAKRHLPR